MTGVGRTSRVRLTAAERRAQIVESAHRVFVRQGLSGSRTREIAAEAGVNEALVYQHFRSKAELFEAVLEAALEDASAHFDSDLVAMPLPERLDIDTVKRLTVIQVRQLLTAFVEVEPLLGTVLYGGDEAASARFRSFLGAYLGQTRQVMEGYLPRWEHVEFDPQLAAEAVVGVVWARVLIARLEGRVVDMEGDATGIADLVLDGLAAREHPG